MRYLLKVYLVLLAVNYAWNPLVPAPRPALQNSRTPQSARENVAISSGAGILVTVDKNGLIVQRNGDGGDTAQRTGMFYYLHDDPAGFTQALDHLEVYPGLYVRHPYQPGFHSDPKRFSRDQQRPLIISLGKYKMTDRLWRMARGQLLRMGKYQNKDFIGPVGIGEYIRAFELKLLYPALMVSDVFLFIGSCDLILSAKADPGEVDDNNHVMTLLQARDVMPTPFGWLARETYRHFRPMNWGNVVLKKTDPVHGALAWYHRPQSGGNPYLGETLYDAFAKE